ncbi:MAG: hypothetical protein QOK15_3829 [Nocardioidaceae bacterium]|nr:hypothetical protein [Nocardioidaceae bacterium]
MTDQTPGSPDAAPSVNGVEPPPMLDLALRAVALELDRHAAEGGWDQPARLFALVHTQDLLDQEPGLAGVLGVDPTADLTASLTPVEQESLPPDEPLEEQLTQMVWPPEVHGTAVVVERLVLPPSVALPQDDEEAQLVAESHPERQEVRMTAAATRDGATYCALRLRDHDDAQSVVEGPDLVPALLELLQATLTPVDPMDPRDQADDHQ